MTEEKLLLREIAKHKRKTLKYGAATGALLGAAGVGEMNLRSWEKNSGRSRSTGRISGPEAEKALINNVLLRYMSSGAAGYTGMIGAYHGYKWRKASKKLKKRQSIPSRKKSKRRKRRKIKKRSYRKKSRN